MDCVPDRIEREIDAGAMSHVYISKDQWQPEKLAIVKTPIAQLLEAAGDVCRTDPAAALPLLRSTWAAHGRDDRVAFLAPNIPQLLEAHFAVPDAGCVLVPLNTRLGSDEVGYILEHSGAKMLFVDAELERLVEPLDTSGIEVVRIDDTGERGDPYEDYLAEGTAETLPSLLEDEEETISINYTSGTTGKPKGVMYSHRGAYLNALGVALALQMNSDSVYLWVLPMFHCDGWCYTWGVTAIAGTHVCLRKVEPGRIWELFDSEGITHYCGAPTVQIPLVNHENAHELDHQVTTAIGGSPAGPALLEKFQNLNIHPIHLYGLTETYGPDTICAWREEWDELSIEEKAQKNSPARDSLT